MGRYDKNVRYTFVDQVHKVKRALRAPGSQVDGGHQGRESPHKVYHTTPGFGLVFVCVVFIV